MVIYTFLFHKADNSFLGEFNSYITKISTNISTKLFGFHFCNLMFFDLCTLLYEIFAAS